MAQINLPDDICTNSLTFGLLRADSATELLSGAEVVTEFSKAVWYMQFQLKIMRESEARAWRGALTALSRISNYFKVGPPDYSGAIYNGPSPQVKGGAQIGFTLTVDGASAGTTILKAGEYFEVNGELKMAVQDATSDGTGAASIRFEPPLREAPPDNSPLNLETPTAKFRLVEPRSEWNVTPGKFYIMNINAIEAVSNA